jgi:hypothetical protein
MHKSFIIYLFASFITNIHNIIYIKWNSRYNSF